MGKFLTIFLICFALAFGVGYLIFSRDAAPEVAEDAPKTNEEIKEEDIELQEGDAKANEGRILVQTGCISCHSVSALNLQGGATGPDLSNAYTTVEGKHGLPIEEYLQNPTSAVMSTVIAGDPLTEDELQGILDALKVASEK